MPLTRISLREGRPADQLKIISDTLHQTLVDEFDVPVDDRFQIIDIYPADRLIYDPHYLAGVRSNNYILFHIIAGKKRSRQQKQNFYRILTSRLVTLLGMSPDDVMVIVQFTAAEDWCFSNGQLLELETL